MELDGRHSECSLALILCILSLKLSMWVKHKQRDRGQGGKGGRGTCREVDQETQKLPSEYYEISLPSQGKADA